MSIANYRRTTGKKLLYNIYYDADGYVIRESGQLRKRVKRPAVNGNLAEEEREIAHLSLAVSDIENLLAMKE